LPDGQRPIIRTLTPRRVDPDLLELDVVVVIHESGMASEWVQSARPGDPAAVSGPARGYTVDTSGSVFLLAGDETAIPAISQLMEHLPLAKRVHVEIEIASPDARVAMPERPGATVNWRDLPSGAAIGESLLSAVAAVPLGPETRVWVAGEAAAVQRIRRHLFEERGLSRAHATVRGYWKHGQRGGLSDDS
jgi:NADPH-dependent ferric siderophore reductase